MNIDVSRYDECMKNAMNDVKCGMSIRKAASKWGVGKTTLISRLKDDEIKRLKKNSTNGVLFLYDIHIPHHDEKALSTAINFARENYNIVKIVLGGDIMDCESLSKFDKTKNTVAFSTEIETTKEFLDSLRNTFRDAQIVFLMGNHEERLEKYINKNAPELQGVADSLSVLLDFKSYNIDFVDNRKLKSKFGMFYKVEDFTVLHGHEIGICPIVSPAYKFLEKAKDNLILGHIHSPDEKVMTTIDGKIIRCYSVGTLAKLSPMYKPFNSWGQGFCVMELREEGNIVKNYRIFDGKIY